MSCQKSLLWSGIFALKLAPWSCSLWTRVSSLGHSVVSYTTPLEPFSVNLIVLELVFSSTVSTLSLSTIVRKSL